MKQDNRLSRVLHVLLHMAHNQRPMTSEEIATFLKTNAVVVRRELSGLRELGYVRSEKGHRGGWSLACDLKSLSLFEVYQALGSPKLIALGVGEGAPSCLVARAVNHELAAATHAAEQQLLKHLKRVSLAKLATHFSAHHPHKGHTAHEH